MQRSAVVPIHPFQVAARLYVPLNALRIPPEQMQNVLMEKCCKWTIVAVKERSSRENIVAFRTNGMPDV